MRNHPSCGKPSPRNVCFQHPFPTLWSFQSERRSLLRIVRELASGCGCKSRPGSCIYLWCSPVSSRFALARLPVYSRCRLATTAPFDNSALIRRKARHGSVGGSHRIRRRDFNLAGGLCLQAEDRSTHGCDRCARKRASLAAGMGQRGLAGSVQKPVLRGGVASGRTTVQRGADVMIADFFLSLR